MKSGQYDNRASGPEAADLEKSYMRRTLTFTFISAYT